MNRFALGLIAILLTLIFAAEIPAAMGATEKTIYDFCIQRNCTDGSEPVGGLISDNKGNLYGTTNIGGVGLGTVFKLIPDGTETVLHAFQERNDGNSPMSALIKVNGKLYGTTVSGGSYFYDGTVFSVDPLTGAETVLHSFGGTGDGSNPYGALIDIRGTLYGTTKNGGSGAGGGTVFSFNQPMPPRPCCILFVVDQGARMARRFQTA